MEVLLQNASLLSCDNVTLPSGTKVSRTYYLLCSKGTYTPNNRVPHSENLFFTVATVKNLNPTQLSSVCNARMLFNWQVVSLFTVMEGSEVLTATHQCLDVLAHYMTEFYSPYLKKVLEIFSSARTHAHTQITSNKHVVHWMSKLRQLSSWTASDFNNCHIK